MNVDAIAALNVANFNCASRVCRPTPAKNNTLVQAIGILNFCLADVAGASFNSDSFKCHVKISRLNVTLDDGHPGIAFATVRNGGVDCQWAEQQKHADHPAQKDKFNDSSIFHRLASIVLFT